MWDDIAPNNTMLDEQPQPQDSPNPDGTDNPQDLDLETVDETPSEDEGSKPEEDVEKLKTTNKRLYKRLKDTEKERDELKSKVSPPQEPNPPPTNPSSDRLDRLELKTEGYNSEEADFILKNGGLKAVADPYVQAAIKSMRDKKKSEEATPEKGAGAPVYKRHTADELKSKSVAELEKILPHAE